jgi:anti-anti-sigma factor
MYARRPRWVIAELDVNGEIDDHAAMCMQFALEAAGAVVAGTVLVDLRELTAIDDAGLALFVRHDADCRATDVQLSILICADARQEAIVRAFTAAGLGDRLQFTLQSSAPPWPPARARVQIATSRSPRRAATARP